MTLGPLEYLVVGFEGNRFTGQILAELRAAHEKGIIRVLDILRSVGFYKVAFEIKSEAAKNISVPGGR